MYKSTLRFRVSITPVLFLSLLTVAAAVSARDPVNPDGFSSPDGYVLTRSEALDYQPFPDKGSYFCGRSRTPCAAKDFGFDDTGHVNIEGSIETAVYKKPDGSPVAGFLLQRNYERVIENMGGHFLAHMNGHDEKRGHMKVIHSLTQNGQRKWIHVNTYASSNELKLSVVTIAEMSDILSAGALKNELDAQGFVTLNVNFDTGKALVRPADQATLDQVFALLKTSPELRLSVDGHTDNVGNVVKNQNLSQQRADAIVEYLVAAGVTANRLQAKGYGQSTPVADNRSEEGRSRNRRVELVKLK